MNNKLEKTIIIIIILLIILIIAFNLIYYFTPLKNILFKKATSQEEETVISKIEETVTKESSEEKTEETEETTEVSTTTEGVITTVETTVRHAKSFEEYKYQGIIREIDYDKKIITIENAITGEIEVLETYRVIELLGGYEGNLVVYERDIEGKMVERKFEDIKVGYYMIAYTFGEADMAEFYDIDPDVIHQIEFSEERWW